MVPIDSTAEILLWKHLNRSVDDKWRDWAYAMLLAGFDTEHLIELAGIEKPPYNQFELQDLTSKVFDELKLDYSNREKLIKDYVLYLMHEVTENKREILMALRALGKLYNKTMNNKLLDFYLLYNAKEDLNYTTYQHYWPDADRSNIDKVVLDYFETWRRNNSAF